MERVPLLLPLTALTSGIVAAMCLPECALILSLISAIAVWPLWVFLSRRAALFCVFASVGSLAQYAATPEPVTLPDGQREYVATVTRIRNDEGSRLLRCSVDGVGDVDIRLYGAEPLLVEGDVISFHAGLAAPQIVEPIIPDEDVYSQTDAVAECRISSASVRIVEHRGSVRNLIIERILGSELSDAAGSMLCALLVGDTELIDDDTRSKYSAAGISHVLALSGLHVGVIAMLIAMALWPLYLGRHNRTRLLVTIALLWAYAALTGFSPSVTRAVIMATVYMLGRVIQRPGVPLNSLCFAAILILLFRPSDLTSVSFQLSFAAVAGILIFYPVINQVNRRSHPLLYKLVGYPAVSLAAMSLTGILSAFYFHSYPLYFLAANLLISPLVPLMIGGGAVLVVLLFLGFRAVWLCHILDFLVSLCNSVADGVASLPGHAVAGLYFPWWMAALLIAAMLLLALSAHRRRLAPAIAAVIVGVIAVQVNALAAPMFPSREHFFLNDRSAASVLVRHGDSLFVVSSAPTPRHQREILERWRTRYRHYQSRRRIDTMMLCPDTIILPGFSRKGEHFSLHGRRYRFLTDNHARPTVRIDYLVVAKGFTGNVVTAARLFAPDSAVVLSPSLNPRRLRRYASELAADSIPFVYFR